MKLARIGARGSEHVKNSWQGYHGQKGVVESGCLELGDGDYSVSMQQPMTHEDNRIAQVGHATQNQRLESLVFFAS